ncbi:ARM repeat superfamily protein [Quillaja saponaria]|uniref:ARM repeat superfamily protein n=1 Tax=Quillaja saponaria TaxID=32244 RepID=A0AAD7Q7M1_QUISA|nr:ARM repeat superfamily protein [Quillaja saponaria]
MQDCLFNLDCRILNAGLVEGNSQKRLSAIQMVNFLMKSLDRRSIFSELELIIVEMEKCQSDKIAFVKGAAFEALQTAKRISIEKASKFEKSPASVTGSNFTRRDYNGTRNLSSDGDQSPTSISPESRILDFFPGYESLVESPVSMRHVSQNSGYDRRSVNRKLWSCKNGGVDVSLKDGLFSDVAEGNAISNSLSECSMLHEFSNNRGDSTEEFAGFLHRDPRNGLSRSTTTSPMRSRSRVNVDNIMIFKTPRKLIHSLQDLTEVNSDCSEKKPRRFRSLSSSNIEWSPASKYDQNGFSHGVSCDCKENESLYAGGEQFQGGPESVSSTDDVPADARSSDTS